jgi:hypothetical protein
MAELDVFDVVGGIGRFASITFSPGTNTNSASLSTKT